MRGDGALRHRTLGRTGLVVSELGYGAWGIGGTMWIGADDEESLRALRQAIELGVNFIDTAYGYGDGHSEELVGSCGASGCGDGVRGDQDPAAERTVAGATRRARAGRLPGGLDPHVHGAQPRNLGLETIDVQQFHVWSDEWVDQGDWLEAVNQLERDGKIRFFGVSINDHHPTAFCASSSPAASTRSS